MKKNWINLELYFESCEFSNVRDFSDFYEFIFYFKMIKTIKKGKKRVYFSQRRTWIRRGTQGHVAKPYGPTRAPTWRGCDTCSYVYFLVI